MVDRPSRRVPPGAQPHPGEQADRRPEAPPNPTGNGASGRRRAPADAQFWFGEPMPEDALPPLDASRNGHATPDLRPTPGDNGHPPTPGDNGHRSGMPTSGDNGHRSGPPTSGDNGHRAGLPTSGDSGHRSGLASGNGHAPGLLPPTPGDTRYPAAAPRRPVNGAPADRARPGPADGGPPSIFFTPADPADPPRWPTLADSPSLRLPPVSPAQHVTEPVSRRPVEHVTEPVSRRPPAADAETTAVIAPVPAAPAPTPPPVAAPAPAAPAPAPAAPAPAAAPPPVRDEATQFAPRPVDPEPEPEPEPESEDRPDEDEPKHGKHRKRKKQPLWRELVTLVAVALLLTFLIQHFVGRVYSIPSGSMEQTLHGCPGCTGDRVFVDKMVYDFREPLPGDVVVFQGPNSWTGEQVVADGTGANPVVKGLQYLGSLIGIAPPDERDFVKRVIAIGGQTVECCDDQMRVMVDGKPLDEPYVHWESGGPDERQRFAPVTVPEGTLWVMGDNRANSADSRIQGGGGIRGVVPITKVIGKVRAIVLPPSRWQGVGDHNPQAPPAVAAPAWQQGLPAGLGIAAAWPVLWLSRRIKNVLTSRKAE